MNGETTNAGTRTPYVRNAGLSSCAAGGNTWSKNPPCSSYVTTSIVFFQFGLLTSAVYVFSTSSWPALMSDGGWSSFDPAGPTNETSTKFGSIHETAGSFPSFASSMKLRGARMLRRSK